MALTRNRREFIMLLNFLVFSSIYDLSFASGVFDFMYSKFLRNLYLRYAFTSPGIAAAFTMYALTSGSDRARLTRALYIKLLSPSDLTMLLLKSHCLLPSWLKYSSSISCKRLYKQAKKRY